MTIEYVDLNGEVKNLAHSRAQLATLEAELAERRKAFDAENETLLSAIADAKARTAQHETSARDMAYAIADERGEMRPHPAILTKHVRVPIYEPAEAVAWALSHNMAGMIDLKKRAYEKALLSSLAADMPGQVIDDFQVTIKTDLAAWLAEESEYLEEAHTDIV